MGLYLFVVFVWGFSYFFEIFWIFPVPYFRLLTFHTRAQGFEKLRTIEK